MEFSDKLSEGARNLLINCAGIKRDDTVLIISETPDLGWYDTKAPNAVTSEAMIMGAEVSQLEVGKPENHLSSTLTHAIAQHDCTIFFSRIGDQDRFSKSAPGKKSVMCYARNAEMLASSYGRAPHQALYAMKEAVNTVMLTAQHIEITCPLGTDYAGQISKGKVENPVDVSVLRFPLGVPAPINAHTFSGRIALAGYLTPTGSKSYEPACLKLEQVIFAKVEAGRILNFEGDYITVNLVQQHYDKIADEFGIDRDIVHSWHAGIHPGCAYKVAAVQDPDRWSNTVFTNPRFLHFHTCGDYAPGEICWMVLDPTICIDGVDLWDKGRLHPNAFAQTGTCLEKWPELKDLYENPSDEIGITG